MVQSRLVLSQSALKEVLAGESMKGGRHGDLSDAPQLDGSGD